MSEEQSGNEYRQQRIENMNQLEEAGFPAFGSAFERTARLDELHASFELGRQVNACGRIVAIRKMGKMAFAHISDGSAKLCKTCGYVTNESPLAALPGAPTGGFFSALG